MLKAVVLAAGKGTRLYPATRHVAKPLLPLVNRTTLHYAFDRLRQIGVDEVCVVVGENEGSMRASLGDGSSEGVRLSYARQVDPQGLAHAVGFAREFVAGDPFVLYLGDVVYSEPIAAAASRFAEGDLANLSLVKWVEDPRRFGVATLAGERIVRLVEKPAQPESNWAMAGLYFFGPELWDVLPSLKPSARGEYEITDAIQALIDAGRPVGASRYDGSWFDTGTLDSFLATNRFLASGRSDVAGTVRGDLGRDVFVGEGATVECASIANSVVLPGSRIAGDASLEGCLLGGVARLSGTVCGEIVFGDERSGRA